MLPKQHRLTRPDEFRTVMRTGRRRGGAMLVAHVRPTGIDAPSRFGFIVSKAVGDSVTRHRVQRRLRAVAAEGIASGFRGAEVVVRALPASAQAPFVTLRTELLRHLRPETRQGVEA